MPTCFPARHGLVCHHHVVRVGGHRELRQHRDVAEQLAAARVHAAHEGRGVLALHVVHDVEVAHLVVGGTAG